MSRVGAVGAIVAVAAAAGSVTVPALAGTPAGGSSAPSAKAPAAPRNPAVVRWVSCRSRCRRGEVRPGSLLRVYGSRLSSTSRVSFLGAAGGTDDITARALRVRASQFDVRIPAGVATGPVEAIDRHGRVSAPSRAHVVVLGSAGSSSPAVLTSLFGPPGYAHGQLVDLRLDSTRVVYDIAPLSVLHVVASAGRPVDVDVDVARADDGSPVVKWATRTIPAGGETAITWNGPGAGGAAPGQYVFQVYARPSGSPASSAQTAGPDVSQPFTFQPYVFPVAGSHTFADGAGRFGAARNGHTHQGQDVLSPCGTPLLAARGGKVKYRGYQSAAGNYLVIDADGTPQDMVYMHLRSPAMVAKGAHVATGQQIGYVGRTGDATACHLHFELWTGPGWYTGGHPIDPLPTLRAWAALGVPAQPAQPPSSGNGSAPAAAG